MNIKANESAIDISIVMICYNGEKFLERSLDAIFTQTYENFEFIFVNDGSTDASLSIVKNYKEKYGNKIHIICQENQGVIKAWTNGISKCCGQYIMLHDADDWMENNCLEKLITSAKSFNSDRVIGRVRSIDKYGKKIDEHTISGINDKWLKWVHHGDLYRASLFFANEIIIPNDVMDDFYLSNILNCYIKKVSFVDDIVYNFYINDSSLTHIQRNKGNNSRIINDFRNTIKLLIPFIKTRCGKEDQKKFEFECVWSYYSIIVSYIWTLYPDNYKLYCDLSKTINTFFPQY